MTFVPCRPEDYTPGFIDFRNKHCDHKGLIRRWSKDELLRIREMVIPLAALEKLTKTNDIHDDFEVLLENINGYLR